MLVMFGNTNPLRADSADGAPRVTTIGVPDADERDVGGYSYEVADSAADLAGEILRSFATGGGQTRLPGQEAAIAVLAAWNAESGAPPAWVWSDDTDFAVLLGHLFACPVGIPADVEATHHTNTGPPGVAGRDAEADAELALADDPTPGSH